MMMAVEKFADLAIAFKDFLGRYSLSFVIFVGVVGQILWRLPQDVIGIVYSGDLIAANKEMIQGVSSVALLIAVWILVHRGWEGYSFRRKEARRAEAQQRARFELLSNLPPEERRILKRYIDRVTQTFWLSPINPEARSLVHKRVLHIPLEERNANQNLAYHLETWAYECLSENPDLLIIGEAPLTESQEEREEREARETRRMLDETRTPSRWRLKN